MAFLTLLTLPDGFILKFQKTLHYYPMHNNYKANTRHLKIFSLLQVIKVIETVIPTITSSFWPVQSLPLWEWQINWKCYNHCQRSPRDSLVYLVFSGNCDAQRRANPPVPHVLCQMQQSDEAGSKGPNLSFKTKGTGVVQKHWQSWKQMAFKNDQEDDIQKLCCCHNADKMGKVIREKKKRNTSREIGLSSL